MYKKEWNLTIAVAERFDASEYVAACEFVAYCDGGVDKTNHYLIEDNVNIGELDTGPDVVDDIYEGSNFTICDIHREFTSQDSFKLGYSAPKEYVTGSASNFTITDYSKVSVVWIWEDEAGGTHASLRQGGKSHWTNKS